MNYRLGESPKPVLNLLVAHMPEAKPLIRQFGLQAISTDPHPLYGNEEGIYLTVSGNGARAMSLACAHLAGRQQEFGVAPAWVNIGIAGHGSAAVGSGLLVNKVCNKETGDSFYPTPLLSGLSVSTLLTVNEIEREYPDDHAYDMEGAAFWEAASRYGQLDFVQLFKIVSDNPDQHVDHFDLAVIPDLFAAQTDSIAEIVAELQALAKAHLQAHDVPKEIHELLTRRNFTATQRVQLFTLARRWAAFGRRDQLLDLLAEIDVSNFDSRQIIEMLGEQLRRLQSLSRVDPE